MNIPPEVQAKIDATQRAQAAEDAAGRQAAATPLPGPLRDVFALVPDIAVGPFKVRPFYDIDFEFLTALNHPLKDMMVEGKISDKFLPTGAMAWQLCWMMTRPVDEADAVFKKGVLEVNVAARAEFGKLQLPALAKLIEAVIRQMTIYWSPSLEYGAVEQRAEGESVSANP